jgi:hypothetical protein
LLSVFAACSDDPAPAPVVDAGAPDVAEDTAPPPGSITVAVQEAVTVRRGQSTKFTATLTRGAGTGKPVTFKAKSLGQGLTMADATASGTDTTFELELKASGAAALGFGTASITYQVEGQTPKEVALRVLVTDGTSGGYDNDLGNGGYVQVVVKAGAAISGVGVVAKPEGIFVLAASAADESFLVKFDDQGALDTAFGSQGIAKLPAALKKAKHLAASATGLFAMGTGTGDTAVIIHLGLDGQPIAGFGTQGVATSTLTSPSFAALGSGGVVVAGLKGTATQVCTLNANGAPASFGTAGCVTPDFVPGLVPYGLSVSGDKQPVLLAYETGAKKLWLVRYQDDGAYDPTFGNAGRVTVAFDSLSQGLQNPTEGRVSVSPALSVFSAAQAQAAGGAAIGVGKTTKAGSSDAAFSKSFLSGERLAGLIALPDEKPLVLTAGNGLYRRGIDGKVDNSFGVLGTARPAQPAGAVAGAFTLDAAGRVVVVGSVPSGEALPDAGAPDADPDASADASVDSAVPAPATLLLLSRFWL